MPKPKKPDSLTPLERLAQDPNAGKKLSKYRIKKTEYNGRIYDSPAEARRAKELDNDPAVAWWIPQVTIELGIPEHKYKVDFLVAIKSPVFHHVCIHAEDVKGFETPSFRKHKTMWKKYGKFPLHVLHVTAKEVELEVINP